MLVAVLVAVLVAALDYCSSQDDRDGSLDFVHGLLCDSQDWFPQVVSELALPHANMLLLALQTLAAAPDEQDDGTMRALLTDTAGDLQQRFMSSSTLEQPAAIL